MPGFDPMAPQGGPSMDEMRKQMEDQERLQLERARQEQAKQFTRQFIEQRGITAEEALQAVQQMPRTASPFDLTADVDELGLSSIGARTNVQFSPRIGATFGGSYAPGRSATGEVLGQQNTVNAPGQYAAQAAYRSPFINVDVKYTPRRYDPFGNAMGGGFTGQANMGAKW